MSAPDFEPSIIRSHTDAPAELVSKDIESTAAGVRTFGFALAAGLFAGTLAWLAGELILDSYRMELTPKMERTPAPESLERFARVRVIVASTMFAGLGTAIGLGLGVAGGLARRSVRAGLRAAILGGTVGAAAGFLAGLLILPAFFGRYNPQSHELMDPLLTIGAIAAVVGAAGGLAFGVGLGGRGLWLKTLVGGLLGAALGAALYEILGAVALPTGGTELPISNTRLTRALLHLGVATSAAVGSVLSLRLSARKQDAPPPPAS